MAKHNFEITSIFSKWLGAEARELATEGVIKIIETEDFPDGAPIHEDGSSVYDPKKPLVLFAIQLSTEDAIRRWNAILHKHSKLLKSAA